jgi:hypothetical protein
MAFSGSASHDGIVNDTLFCQEANMKQSDNTHHHGRKTTKVHAIPLAAIVLAVLISLVPHSVAAHPARGQQFDNQFQRIPGQLVPLLNDLKPIGLTPKNSPLHLAIALKLHDESGLDALLAAQEDPTSPLYHHYLTVQEFNSQFSPTQASADTVAAYMRQQGLQVTAITPNHLLIDASTTVATAEHAFSITLNNYQLKSRVVYAPSTNPLLPNDILNNIETISGLNNVALYRPINLQHHLTQTRQQTSPDSGLTPDQLRTEYDVKPLLTAGNDGIGQTVGLFELSGYQPSDITAYRHHYHLADAAITNVLVDGATNTLTSENGGSEVTLDMDVLSAMAPRAAQTVYIGPNTSTGIADTYNRIVTDNTAKIVSISWGECEAASTPARLDLLDTIFKQGAAQGQAFFSASGDSGAYDCSDADQNLAVDSPASDPYVVGVGGTTLQASPTATYVSETAWGNPLTTGQDVGGGGGKSAHFLRPSYQSGPNLTDPSRLVPDVSANADPNTGYSIYFTGGTPDEDPWDVVGGTSAAAPLWAGIATDINHMLSAVHATVLGNAIALLYELYNTPQIYPAYHDIVTGSNLYYQAGLGYDMATGMGTPDAWNIARDLESAPGVAVQLLQNAGFEDGLTNWQEHSKGGYELINTNNPHTGKYSAYLCGYVDCQDSITQTVFIPNFTRKVTLNYWIYVGRGDTSTSCQDHVQVILRTEKGDPIQVVQKLCNTDANGWVPYSFDVTDALAPLSGQKIQVDFEAFGVSDPRSNFFVNLDEVNLLDLTAVPGITTQIIKNPSFEDGQEPWQEASSGHYELINTAIPHTGKYSAYLCGYPHCNDSIFQTVTLPLSTQRATLSYWIYIGRADTTGGCLDTFHSSLRLRTEQGALIGTVQKLCNTDANGWTQYSFDVTHDLQPYLGKPIQVGFDAIGLSTQRTNFIVDVDDVTLYVTQS